MTRTPIIPEKRKPLTRRQRIALWDRHGGRCVVCLFPIPAGEPFVDEHVIPIALGGSNDDANRGPAHIQCAKAKTKLDQKMIARASKQRARHLGIKRKTKGRPMPGTRASGVRKRFDGTVGRW